MRSSSWVWLRAKRERRGGAARQARCGPENRRWCDDTAGLLAFRVGRLNDKHFWAGGAGVAWIGLSRVITPADSEETQAMPARAAGTVGFLQLCVDYGYGAAARLRRGVQERLARAGRYDAAAAILFGALIVLVA